MMNKFCKVSLVAGVMLISISIQAQKLNYGVMGGVNFAVQSELGDIYNNDDIRTGFSAGVFVNYALSDKLGLQVQMNYDQKGSKTETVTNKFDYWSVPILVNYQLFEANKSKLALEYYLGPSVAFLMKAEGVFANDELDNQDYSNDTKSAELGFQTGFTLRYPFNNQSVFLNVKYGMGLTAINDNASDLKNKFWGVGFGYEF